jgi:hypothetical protein
MKKQTEAVEKFSDESMQLWAEARAQVEAATGHLRSVEAFLARRYNITTADKVDPQTGVIERGK